MLLMSSPFKVEMNMKFQKAGLSAVMIAMMLWPGMYQTGTLGSGNRMQAEEPEQRKPEPGWAARRPGAQTTR